MALRSALDHIVHIAYQLCLYALRSVNCGSSFEWQKRHIFTPDRIKTPEVITKDKGANLFLELGTRSWKFKDSGA